LGNFVFKKKKNKYGGTVAQGVFLTWCAMAVFVVAQMAYLLAFLHLCGGTVTKVGIRRAGLFWFFL
jgi:hypothetical protein